MPGISTGIGLGFNFKKSTAVSGVNLCAYISNGVDADIVLNNEDVSAYLSGASKDFTINIMFKRDSIGSKMALFASEDNSFGIYLTAANEISIEQYDSTVLKTATTSNTFTSTTIKYFLTIVYDGTTPANSKIMVNTVDEALASNTLTSNIDATSNPYYLVSDGSANYFDGEIFQFSISTDKAVIGEHTTWNENKLLPNAIFSNIVKLLNVDGDPAYDVPNTTYGLIDTVNPVVSNKVYSPNTTNYGLIADSNATLESLIAADFSVEMWIKPDLSVAGGSLLSKYDDGSNRDFKIFTTGGGNIQAAPYGLGSTQVVANGGLTDGVWQHVVVVLNKLNSKIYVDATNVTTSNLITQFAVPSSTKLRLGSTTTGLAGADFDYSYMRIFDKALSAEEVTELYNGGKQIAISDTTLEANCGWQSIAENLTYDGKYFSETDPISGTTISSATVTQMEDMLTYGGLDVATTRNMLVGDRECNGVPNPGETVDVVYQMHQSNGVGVEPIANLQAEYEGYRGDIKVYQGSDWNILTDDGGFNNPTNPGAFGPQYSLLYKLADYTGRKTFLNAYGIGGSRLYEDAGDDWNANSVGEYLDTALASMQAGDVKLVGYNINRKGVVYNQHENDCGVEVRALAYETNLTALINKTRTVYPDIPFYIVLVHEDLTEPYASTVKTAQLNVIAAMDDVYGIDQDSASTSGDGVHRDAAGYEELGRLEFEAVKAN